MADARRILERTNRRLAPLVIGLVLVLASAVPVRAQRVVVQGKDPGWTILLPDGWHQCDKRLIDEFDAETARRVGKRDFKFIDGFVRGKRTGVLKVPYVLVQWTAEPLRGHSIRELERELKATDISDAAKAVRESLGDMVSGVEFNHPYLDIERRRMIMRMELESPAGKMRGLCIGFLANDGIVQLNFYAKSEEFDSQLPQFEELANAFHFDPGVAWEPSTMPRWMRGALIGGVVGGAIGAASALVRKARR